jgi:hypothetical protein
MKMCLLAISLIPSFTSALACEIEPKNIQCNAIFSNDILAAYFPVVNNKEKWDWFRKEQTPERTEFAWIAEPGNCRKGKFTANGVAFTATIGSLNLKNTPPAQGSISDLLKASSKYAYFSTKPESNENHSMELAHRSKVHSKVMSDGDIVLTPVDEETKKLVRRGHPTHMRMRAILPELSESYECIVKIDTVKLP